MPALVCRTRPARSMRRWEAICASAGFSFNVGRKYWLIRMARNVGKAGFNSKPSASHGQADWICTGHCPHTPSHLPGEMPTMLEQLFKLNENQTTVRTEIVAGVTTFLTMA